MEKPTIALIHGAWHSPIHFQPFIQRLHEAGYPTTSKPLPSVGSDKPHEHTQESEVDFIRQNILLPELDQGKDVILVVHSYGGVPGGAAAKGLSKTERTAAGLRGGVIGLIFVCAFIGYEGQVLLEKLPGGKPATWCGLSKDGTQLELTEDPTAIFYNKVTDSSLVETAVKELKPHSVTVYATPIRSQAWSDEAFDGYRAYVFCHSDFVIPVEWQKKIVLETGKSWRELDLEDADHSPFLSKIESLLKFTDELAQEWTAS